MAKIVYWESPIDPTKRKYSESTKDIGGILEELGIEKKTLSVSINGEFPDDISFDLQPEKNDIVEIRSIVNGNNDAEGKNLAANIITIAALVAATILTAGAASPYLIAGITLVGGVASGALRYRAARIQARSGAADKAEVDIAANNFSLTSAQNEFRPLQTLPVPMGSMRAAPDFQARPYPGYWGGDFDTNGYPVLGSQILNPDNPNDWTATMPVGYFATSPYNWPAYELKIDPRYTLADITSMSAAVRRNFAPQFFVGPISSPSKPVLLYHSDPSDPYYGRISPLAIFALQGTQAANSTTAQNNFLLWHDYPLYQAVYGAPPLWFTSPTSGNIVTNNNFRWQLSNTYIRPVPSSPTVNQVANAISLYIFGELNKGISGGVPTSLGFTTFEETILLRDYVSSPNQSVTHIFNHGLGDLVITNKRVEKTLIEDIPQAEISIINQTTWKVPTTFKSQYEVIPRILEGATLNNNLDFPGPANFVAPNDLNNYNFIHRVTPLGTQWVEVDFEGNCYEATSSGLGENRVTFELQYKLVSSPVWTFIALIYFINDNVQVQRFTYLVPSNFSDFPSSEIDFRIRKVEPDALNNNGTKVAQFSITSFKCFLDDTNTDMVGQNVEGLFLVANTQTSGSSNKFTAQIDAKCWVYDASASTWSWIVSRNPAWWFLYFARGGFKNSSADGSAVFPESPTYGWVNGPGYAGSTEIMFGAGLPDIEIDIDGISEWALFCEDRDLYYDAVVKDDSTTSEILEKIANVGRGSTTYYKGKLGVVYEDPEKIPSGLYGMGNILDGSFSVDYSVINVPSKVIGTYSDRDKDWEARTVEGLVPFADTDDLNFISLVLDGVTEEQQAQREVNILAARQYFQKRLYSWKVDHEGLIAQRGDLVYLSHDSTQYGFSGRIVEFLFNASQEITGLKTTSEFKDTAITHVTIRYPDGGMATYACTILGCDIAFSGSYPLAKAPQYPSGRANFDNTTSDFDGSYPDDFIFLAGPRETPGKLVRISEIKADQNFNFTISAVDEDPAMWSYEFGPPINPESFNDSEIVCRVFNVGYRRIEPGLVSIYWEVEGADFIKIINQDTGLPIEAQGAYSFSGSEVIVELTASSKYTLRLEPFVIGTPYAQINKVLVVWP